MQPSVSPVPPVNAGKVAVTQGLVFGIGYGVIGIIYAVIQNLTSLGAAGLLLTALFYLVGLAAYFFVGWRAAQRTGRVGTGALAGLWTGLFASILYLIAEVPLFFAAGLNKSLQAYQSSSLSASSTLNASSYRTILIGTTLFGFVLSVVVGLGIGAGVGALGGLVGRSRSNTPPPPYQQPSQQPY